MQWVVLNQKLGVHPLTYKLFVNSVFCFRSTDSHQACVLPHEAVRLLHRLGQFRLCVWVELERRLTALRRLTAPTFLKIMAASMQPRLHRSRL